MGGRRQAQAPVVQMHARVAEGRVQRPPRGLAGPCHAALVRVRARRFRRVVATRSERILAVKAGMRDWFAAFQRTTSTTESNK